VWEDSSVIMQQHQRAQTVVSTRNRFSMQETMFVLPELVTTIYEVALCFPVPASLGNWSSLEPWSLHARKLFSRFSIHLDLYLSEALCASLTLCKRWRNLSGSLAEHATSWTWEPRVRRIPRNCINNHVLFSTFLFTFSVDREIL
jgi:hypothetical protein